jgi:hypothetical protein
MLYVVIFAVGIISGIGIARYISKKKTSGDLVIDSSDVEDGPYMFLELTENLHYVYRKKYVTLRVRTDGYISQK